MKIIENILRFVFTWIDSIVAWLITTLYNLFYDLSNIMLYSEDVIKSIGQRIGLILGIFMLFRLAITLITYLISPDKMSDNAKGGGKILINIIVSLVLLATVNIIFVQAYKIQKTVISSNVIAKIFFGTKAQTPTVDVGYHLYTGLFSPNTNVLGNECDSLWDTTFQLVGSPCYDKLNSVLDDNARKEIVNARNNQNVSKIFVNYDLVMAKSNGEFVFNYYPIVSTLAGVVAALMLLSFSMDLATRAIKLLFLQLIAPIPIISNMDPGKGQDVFKKWYKECFSTYISLFVRLLVINFAVYMITLITVNFKDIIGCNVFVNILLIIGCLMFAKQVPKLIEEMFGIKMDGGMTLNPLKKFQEQALFGKNITGLAAAGLAGTTALGTNMAARFRMGTREKGFARVWDMSLGAIASGVAGGISATARGTVGALKGQQFGQIYGSAYGGAIKARNDRNSRNVSHVMAPDVWLNSMQRKMGIQTKFEELDEKISVYDEFTSSGEAAVSISESELDKFADKIYLHHFNGGHGVIATNLSGGTSTLNTLAELREAMTDNTQFDATQRATLNAEYNRLRGDIAEDIRTQIHADRASTDRKYSFTFTDSTGATVTKYLFDKDNASAVTIAGHMKNAEEIITEHQDDPIFRGQKIDGKTIKSIAKKTKSTSATTKINDEYKKAKKIQEQTNKEKK